MAVEIVGDPASVKKYRQYLHERGVNTKRFVDAMRKNGQQIAPKPEGYRTFNGSIKNVYGSNAGKKAVNYNPEEKLYIAGIANANAVDRMDERLEPSGIDVQNFMRNAVLLVDHLYVTAATIGKVIDLKAEDDGVHFEAFIGDPKKAPLTQTQIDTRSLVAQKLIQTVSVGFIPHKVKAPEWDNEGKLISPAVILNWELLELSVVAVPANPGAVFDLKEGEPVSLNKTTYSFPKSLTTNAKQARIETKQEDSQTVQTLIFSKSEYTEEDAVKWAKEHSYRTDSVTETDDEYQLAQRHVKDFVEESFRTVELEDGVRAVVGQIAKEVGEANEMDEKIIELLEEMKRLNTLVSSYGDSLKTLLEKNEEILGRLDSSKKPPEDEEEPKEDDKPTDEPPPPPPKEDDDKEPKEDEEDEDKKKDDEEKEDMKSLRKMVLEQNERLERMSGLMLSFIENLDRASNG